MIRDLDVEILDAIVVEGAPRYRRDSDRPRAHQGWSASRRRNFLQFTHTFPYTDQEQRGYSSAHSGCFARAARDATARRDPASARQGERDVEISYSDSEILAGPAKRKR